MPLFGYVGDRRYPIGLEVKNYFFFEGSKTYSFCSLNLSEIELMQKRLPVGVGLSSKTWPRCPPHFLQVTSILCIPKRLSTFSSVLSFEIVSQKLGQPVPESNLVSELKSSLPHAAHKYFPFFLFFKYFPVNAVSVPFSLRTWYSSFERIFFHCSSVFIIFDLIVFASWLWKSKVIQH